MAAGQLPGGHLPVCYGSPAQPGHGGEMRAIFPASFDPITNGHLDIASRSARMFDELYVAVYDKPAKAMLFSVGERVELASAATAHLPNVRVCSFDGLMVEFARQIGASVVVRGMRRASDFESEYQLAAANHELAPEIDVVLLMSHTQWSFISSSLIKEIASLGGDVAHFVPQPVAERLRDKFRVH